MKRSELKRGATPLRRKPMKRKAGAMAAADKAFSLYIRGRDGACRAAGTLTGACGGNLQCAHLISRRYRSLRWSEQGAIALCQAHHVYFTHRPVEWQLWVTRFTPTGLTWDELSYLALNDPPEKAADALARLKETA